MLRRRLTVVGALSAVSLCWSAGVAAAAEILAGPAPSEASIEGKVSLGMIGPLGGIVIVIGVLGLVAGLVRHRRRAAREARAGQSPQAVAPHPAQPPH